MENELSDPRVAAIANKLKWGLGVVAVIGGGVVAAAYTVSLASIAVAGVATLVVVHGAPWASQKVTNFFFNLRKADARADPVTNRERISGLQWQKLADLKVEIESLDAEVQLWAKQIEALPPDEAKDFAEELRVAQDQVTAQAVAWKDAEQASKDFDKVTERVARKWKVAQTGLRIKRLSTKDKEARINDILAAEAAESADKQLAMAFSSLEAIVERGRSKQAVLAHNPSPVLDVPSIEVEKEPSRPTAYIAGIPRRK